MNTHSLQDASIWQITKATARLWLAVMLAKATGSTTPMLKIGSLSVLCRVEFGGLAILIATPASARSLSRSPGRKSRMGDPGSSSMATTDAPTSPPPGDASSSLAPFESGSLGRAFEP